MQKIVPTRAMAADRRELLLFTICAVVVLAGAIGAWMLSAMHIAPLHGDILFIAALFVALIPVFPIAVWIADKIATRLRARLE
jgi:hypothetical protein